MLRHFIIFLLFLTSLSFAQSTQNQDSASFEDDIFFAYKNAMKGVVWAIDNYPYKKEATYKDLITDNKKICSIKIFKQEGGLKIVSIGFYNSSTVEITTYKSFPK